MRSKAWGSRKRVAAASSPAATCKQGATLSRSRRLRYTLAAVPGLLARFGHRNRKVLSDGSNTEENIGSGNDMILVLIGAYCLV